MSFQDLVPIYMDLLCPITDICQKKATVTGKACLKYSKAPFCLTQIKTANPNGTYPLDSNGIICSSAHKKKKMWQESNIIKCTLTSQPLVWLSPRKICLASRTAGRIVVHESLKNSRVLCWREVALDHRTGQLKDSAASLRGSALSLLSLYRKQRMLASQTSLCSVFWLPSKSRVYFNMRITILVEIMA